MKVKKEQSN